MSAEQILHTTGRNNCGGRCLIHAHVRDGEILRLATDAPYASGDAPPLSACARGMNYHKTFLRPDRLQTPLLRVGERGEAKFRPISWPEAVERISEQWIRIRDTYGPGSRYVNYATGVSAAFSPRSLAKRLLALDGGFLDYYNSYSTPCIEQISRLMYGTEMTGSSRDNWLKSKFILLWGHNPAETVFDSAMFYLRKAREQGIPIVVVDPRRSDTVKSLGAEWIGLRPATDAALLDAMAYVIWTEGLADRDFLDRFCIGFDEAHLPPAAQGESVLSYLLGRNDGVPKTPGWAEAITGVPEETIRSLAVRYASAKPAALILGYGAQRHAYGEQGVRGAILLSCMTGNVGIPGGWASGTGYVNRHALPHLPFVPNPYPMQIPVFRWTDAVERGHTMTAREGVRGGERLQSDVKMIMNLAGNCLINQHSDINRTAALLRDTSKCEFILCSDLFLTSSAKFADILLPGVSFLECENLTMPWECGDFLGYNQQIVSPLGEGRFEYDWLREVAANLGLEQAFTQGLDTRGWLRFMYEDVRRREPQLPPFEEFRTAGVYRYENDAPVVAFEQQRRGGKEHPFPTVSGKIALYAKEMERMPMEAPFPAIPRYVPPPEGPQDALRKTYPLQLIGYHTKRRCHSIHDNNPALERLDPQRLWIHPTDAAARGIADGDPVEVFNSRGRTRTAAFVTSDIVPGVVALAQGAWYQPDENGVDQNGSINVLTTWTATPYARGNAQHTNLVEVIPGPEQETQTGNMHLRTEKKNNG